MDAAERLAFADRQDQLPIPVVEASVLPDATHEGAGGRIEFESFEREDGGLRVRLKTEHGTYVKEVLSGEDGRTEPSLSSLLDLPCRCVELDVIALLDAEGEAAEEPRTAHNVFGAGL